MIMVNSRGRDLAVLIWCCSEQNEAYCRRDGGYPAYSNSNSYSNRFLRAHNRGRLRDRHHRANTVDYC
jgi:hypothetical protein